MSTNESSCTTEDRPFITGVVEGFYGRPWTFDQRTHLFGRLRRLALNTYMYAPKDDVKHRSKWRDLYTDDEIQILASLISTAHESSTTFIYALSPGLDMEYSSEDELDKLRKKFDQVRSVGCTSFALLFDDIVAEMIDPDKERFDTFAAAHVWITNKLYEHLNPDIFLFCPTEYCETRAVPTLAESTYLNTVGKQLHVPIHIMWTGPRVVSEELTVEHLMEVQRVFQRKPLIWDNLHANDYDPKRVYMGPFCGRSVAIKKHITGLLTNPNCKYEANFVPIHTMADWARCMLDAPTQGQEVMEGDNDVTYYDPERSTADAVSHWVLEFRSSPGIRIPPIPVALAGTEGLELMSECQNMSDDLMNDTSQLDTTVQAIIAPDIVDSQGEVNSLSADYVQHMEEDGRCDDPPTAVSACTADDFEKSWPTEEHISTLVDMHYLPFGYGRRATKMFEEFAWLLENSLVVRNGDTKGNGLVTREEWVERFESLRSIIDVVLNGFRRFTDCPNKALVSELVPYVWESHGICTVLGAVMQWIRMGHSKKSSGHNTEFWRRRVDKEPWNTKLGFYYDTVKLLTSEERVLNFFYHRAILPLSIISYEIRSFSMAEEEYACAYLQQHSGATVDYYSWFGGNAFAEKHFRPFLLAEAEYSFLCEELTDQNEKRVICFATAHRYGRSVNRFLRQYCDGVQKEYLKSGNCPKNDELAVLNEIQGWHPFVANYMFDDYPAWVDCTFHCDEIDAVPMKRLLQVICTTLAMDACYGVLVTVSRDEEVKMRFFEKIGFEHVGTTVCGRFEAYGLTLDENPYLRVVEQRTTLDQEQEYAKHDEEETIDV